MKTVFKTTVAIIVLISSMMSFSSNGKREHKITIKDQSGHVLYQKAINENGDTLSDYDLAMLKDGLYVFEITKDFEISTKKFVVTNNEVTFLEHTVEKSFKPVLRVNGKRVFISHLALDPEKEMSVKIYFEDELIQADTIAGAKILNRIYHLKEDVTGSYTVIMKTTEGIYKESFTI